MGKLSKFVNSWSYNKRDAIWWILLGVIFWWITAANMNLIGYCNDLPIFDDLTYIPAFFGNIAFMAIGIMGIIISFVVALYTIVAPEDYRRTGVA